MKIEGDVQIGEAARWAPRACGPLTGYPWNLLGVLAMIPLIIFVVVGVPTLATELGAPGWLYLPLVVAIGWPVLFVFAKWNRTWQVGRFKRALVQRGVSNPLPVTFEIQNDALVLHQGMVEWRAPWAAITEIHPVGPYWVFLAQGTPLYLPKRYFGDQSSELTFLAECLSRMSPAAVGRSRKANALSD